MNKRSLMKGNKQHFCSKMCSNLSSLLPIILVLPLFSFFFSFPFLFTIPIAFISTIFLLTLRKKKGSENESLIQDKLQKEEVQPLLNVTEIAANYEEQAEAQSEYSFQSDNESINFSVMDKTFEVNVEEFKPQVDLESDFSLPSDSESSTDSIIGGSFEIDHHNVCSSERLAFDIVHDEDYSDGDDGEEEEEDSLIEIQLPSSHFFEESMQKLESKLPDFLPEYILKQQGLMELLTEMNDMKEDDNLIEIDISMGSTNGQDFGLKQERELAYLGTQCLSD